MRLRLLNWSGAAAWLAEAILTLGLLALALQLIGIAGAFDELGALLACAGVGALAWIAAARVPRDRHPAPARYARHRPADQRARMVARVAVAAVAAPWLGWTIFAYRHGMQTVDTIWYHLPTAARFVQTGSILHLHYFDSDAITAFYPANAELFHALSLLLFKSDLLSPAINLGWGCLALMAGWTIGQRSGRGPHCIVAVLILLGTPALVDTQPGGAYNDTACVALLLSAVAVLIQGGISPRPVALSATAAGLALGTKYTMVVPSIVLGALVVGLSSHGSRRTHAAIWTIGLCALSACWYVRNAAVAGNPLAPVSLHLGPLDLPGPHIRSPLENVGQYLTDSHAWSAYYLPGLRHALGPAWWAIVAFVAAGAAGSLLSGGSRLLRGLGAVSVIGIGAFLLTPQYLGLPGAPFFFVYNVRYAAVAMAIGLVLLPLHPRLSGERAGVAWLGLAALVLAATELDGAVWSTHIGSMPFAQPVTGTPALAGALLGLAIVLAGPLARRTANWAAGTRPKAGRVRGALVAATLSAVALFGYPVSQSYARHRYADTNPLPRIFAWARSVRHQRIGIVGANAQYPLYGPDSSNYVQYIGEPEPHAGFGPVSSCREWRHAVDQGRYRWLVVAPQAFPLANRRAPEIAWTASSPAAVAVIRERAPGGPAEDVAVLFRVMGPLGAC